MMKLERIEINNFLSFGKNQVKEFTVNEAVLVTGEIDGLSNKSNGAGKTAFMEAFYWCLTGVSSRGLSATKMVNRLNGSKSCSVEATFSVGDDNYIVKRVWSASKKSLEVNKNGKKFLFHNAKEATKSVLDDLGVSSRIFSLVTFCGKRFKSYLQLSNLERADLLSFIIGSDKWVEAKQAAKDELADVLGGKRELDRLVDGSRVKVAEIKTKMLEHKKEFLLFTDDNVLEKNIAKVNAGLGELVSRLATLEQEQKNLNNNSSIVTEFDILEDTKTKDLTKANNEFNIQIYELEGKVREVKLKIDLKRESITSTDVELKVEGERLGKAFKALKNSTCTVCSSVLEKEKVNSILSKELFDSLSSKAVKLNKELKSLESEFKGHNTSIHELREENAASIRRIESIAASSREALKKKDYNRANRLLMVGEEITKCQQDIKRREDFLKQAENKYNVKKSSLENNFKISEASFSEESKNLKSLEEDLAKREQESKVLDYWVSSFQALRFSSFERVCDIFQELINYYANVLGLSFDSIFIDGFKGSRPKIDILAKIHNKVVSVDSMSEGELKRLELSCFFAIKDLVSEVLGYKQLITFLDEPFSSIDSFGKGNFIEALKELSKTFQLFIADHDPNFNSAFTNSVKIVKTNGVSSIA